MDRLAEIDVSQIDGAHSIGEQPTRRRTCQPPCSRTVNVNWSLLPGRDILRRLDKCNSIIGMEIPSLTDQA